MKKSDTPNGLSLSPEFKEKEGRSTMKYQVCKDDNFHYMDETERIDGNSYDTYEEAVEEARRIVDRSLRWERLQSKDSNDPDELYDRYQDFGDDPFVRPGDPDHHFSAWDYAKERCKTIVKEDIDDESIYDFEWNPSKKESSGIQCRWSQELYIKAYKYAARAHHGQCVPGSDLPYITHLSFVSMEIMSSLSVGNKRNGDLAVQCALLHDILEDTGVTYEQVKDKFGIVVDCGVQALTKNKKDD